MGAESRLRQRHRDAIRAKYPRALIVGQPANGFTGPGRHDLYAVVQGRYVGLELKVSTGRATPIQLQRITDTRRAGGWAWVVYTPAQSLGAINLALRGVRVPENKDFSFESLFGEDGAAPAETMSAFLESPDTQVVVPSTVGLAFEDEGNPFANLARGVNFPVANVTQGQVTSADDLHQEALAAEQSDPTQVEWAALLYRIDAMTQAVDAMSVLLQDLLTRLAGMGVFPAVPEHPADPEPAVKKGRSKAAVKAPANTAAEPEPTPAPAEEMSLEDFLS